MVSKICPVCGDTFFAKTRNKIYCTIECSRMSHKAAKEKAENRVIPERKPARKRSCKYKRAIFECSDSVGYPHLKAVFAEYGLKNTNEITPAIAKAYVLAHKLKL